jgi:quercetin dioxygenase-like cupin family protein
MTTTKTIALAVLALSLASVAQAGECPANKVGVDVTPPGPMMPSNVTDNVVSTINLGAYQAPGREFRLRRLEIKPGGVVPWHSHATRPAHIFVFEGAVTEYRSTCSVPIEHVKGDSITESGPTSHWWRNNGRTVAVIMSADVLPAKVGEQLEPREEPGM